MEEVSHRLNTNQFLALRSIARESWNLDRYCIQWRFNGKWFYIVQRRTACIRQPLDWKRGGHCGYEAIAKRAWVAAWEIEDRELVEVHTVRCCPGTACHNNDRHYFRLTCMATFLATLKAHFATRGTRQAGVFPQAIDNFDRVICYIILDFFPKPYLRARLDLHRSTAR